MKKQGERHFILVTDFWASRDNRPLTPHPEPVEGFIAVALRVKKKGERHFILVTDFWASLGHRPRFAFKS